MEQILHAKQSIGSLRETQTVSLVRAIGFVLLANGMKQEFWAIPKAIFSKREISLEARVLYGILFTRANGENVAWPGQKNLAETMGIGERSVRRYLDELKQHDLIESERLGMKRTNRYFLINEKEVIGQLDLSRQDKNVLSRQDKNVLSIGKEQIEKNSSNELAPHGGADDEKISIQAIIEKFKILNPSFERIYGNKTQRSALERLVKKYGVTKIEGAIKIASLAAGKKYAPSITTPLELEEKLGKLVNYYKRENERGAMLVKL